MVAVHRFELAETCSREFDASGLLHGQVQGTIADSASWHFGKYEKLDPGAYHEANSTKQTRETYICRVCGEDGHRGNECPNKRGTAQYDDKQSSFKVSLTAPVVKKTRFDDTR